MAFDEAYDMIARHLCNTLDDDDYAEFSEALEEVRRASPASVPEGWKLVPVEPTEKMVEAGEIVQTSVYDDFKGNEHVEIGERTAITVWQLMLAAAPTPPVSDDPWLPIETAPKDGKSVLAWIPQIELPGAVYCSNGKWYWVTSGGWAGFPTHWMPLPKAPAMQEDKL